METKQFKGFDVSWYTKNKLKSFLKKLGSSFGFVIVLMPLFGIIYSIGNAFQVKVMQDIGKILFANIGIWFALAIIIGFTSNKGSAVLAGVISYLVFNVFIASFISDGDKTYFNIWFWKKLQSSAYLSDLFFGGIKTFNSGVLGGILIGTYVTLIFNRFKDTNLPKGLEFFAKERFAIILSIICSIGFASIFIIIWPLIGYALIFLGNGVAKSPIGIDSFIFRIVQRMLIPFGSSLLWQSPMWYSQVGGSLIEYQQDLLIQYLLRTQSDQLSAEQVINLIGLAKVTGQENITENILKVLGSEFDRNIIDNWFKNTTDIFSATGDQLIWSAIVGNSYITADDCWNVGFRVSRFISGGYVNSIFVLPTLSFTMLFLTPKGERRSKMGMYITAALSAMLIGVTEPVEYLFCYSMPLFYFVIYCPFNGIIAAITSLSKVKIGTSFSTGIFDLTLSGVIPTIKGSDTKIYLIPVIGVISSITIFTIAFFWFRFFERKEKAMNIAAINLRDSLHLLIDELGGIKNINKFDLIENNLKISFKRNPEASKLLNNFDLIKKTEGEFNLAIRDDKLELLNLTKEVILYKQKKD
ncbi:PTS transporter subunit EIIC [Spiroplasma monobiae]|uniref:PTS system glucose-specific IIBC component n=1 Tax=Spiroplasma monobiae MQ-1 TaxID=1336748 RepID=A0A2K9LU93_SPISQ|nr:PTS transporter subunit EIIC [Spiroplasma monobiae]AUM62639.1 PTS system glucose-specific IIBC component [Spiroplasma monobiae MQ-1]